MKWNPSLECGVEQVDNEHKELFSLVGKLSEYSKGNSDAGTISEALAFLGNYVVNHFKHEEALMDECDYPKKDEHQVQHELFIQTFQKLNRKYQDSGASPLAVREIYHAAAGWLVSHVEIVDHKFTKYYKDRM